MGKFKCAWCGEHNEDDKKLIKILTDESLRTCPYCGKESYCNSLQVPFLVGGRNGKEVKE